MEIANLPPGPFPRYAHRVLAGIVVVAVAVMSVASFLPFLQTPCGNCLATPTYTVQVSTALAQSHNAWIVVATLLLLTTASLLHMVEVRPALTALGCLVFSVVAVAFPFVAVANNGSLLFPGATSANAMTTEAGFYVFLLGAAVAAVASLGLVQASLLRARESAPARLGVPS